MARKEEASSYGVVDEEEVGGKGMVKRMDTRGKEYFQRGKRWDDEGSIGRKKVGSGR